jgi:hypothetical protein
MTRKRKLSAYNIHMRKEVRAGKTFKQAAASWKGRGKTHTGGRAVAKRRRKTGRVRRYYAKHREKIDLLAGAIGATTFALIEPSVDKFLAGRVPAAYDDFVKAGGGILLMRYGKQKYLKEVGRAAYYIGINRLAQNKFGLGNGTKSQSASNGLLF